MATTRVSGNIAGTPVKSARFSCTADNDVLFTADSDMLIVGYFVTDDTVITALNVDAGIDLTEFPHHLKDGEDLCVTSTGASAQEVTVFYIDDPSAGYDTFTI